MDELEKPAQETIDSPETEGTDRMVPIAEAMRYRHKAQEAETRVEELTRQLEELQSRRRETAESEQPNVPARTSGAKDPRCRGSASAQAARRAVKSGRRADVHEYMRTRRSPSRSSLL